MIALAWPIVALVGIAAAYVLAERWLTRSVDVDAAHRLLADAMHKTEQVAHEALRKAKEARPEVVRELDNRVSTLETAMGMRAMP